MAEILSIGLYLPRNTLSRSEVAAAWNRRNERGAKRIAGFDEDSLTMAVEASLRATASLETSGDLDSLYFASTSPPYIEGSAASLISTVLDLRDEIRTIDMGGSLKSATTAMILAADVIRAGGDAGALIVAADCRTAAPGSELEGLLGDGAVALILGRGEGLAEIVASASVSDDFNYTRRASGRDGFLRVEDKRFFTASSYAPNVSSVISRVLKKARLHPAELSCAAIASPDARDLHRLAKELSIPQHVLFSEEELILKVGQLGVAQPLLLLVAALLRSKPGDAILLANYGNGCDAVILKAKEKVEDLKRDDILDRALQSSGRPISYSYYLRTRGLIKTAESDDRNIFTSPSLIYRDREWLLKLYAKKCVRCNTVLTLNLKVCPRCRARGDFEKIKLSKEGKVFSFTHEYYYPSPCPPSTMAVVDLDSGGRLLVQLADSDPDKVNIGMRVRLVLRKIHEGGGFNNYYWKAVPLE